VYLSQVSLFRKRGVVKFSRLCAIVLCSVIATSGVHAQSTSNDASAPKGAPYTEQPQPKPDTADGLRDLIQRMVTAAQQNDSRQMSDLTHSLIIPNYATWFPHVFGTEVGSHMAQLYGESLPDFEVKFKDSVEQLVSNGRTDITVTRFDSSDAQVNDSYSGKLIKAMQNPVPVYTVGMNKPGENGRSIPGCFVFVEGNFRHINWHSLGGVPNLLPSRIRVGGNVQIHKMVHQVMPEYPADAKVQHIQGTEVLHAVIDFDGTMLSIEWVSGPPELMKSAMDAVKQWRYEPTLLNGEPVQVDTTISVVYTLGHN
jgi:TonB family protein